MKYLVDTQILIWWVNGDKNLKSQIKDVLKNPFNHVWASVVSGLEIAIKTRTGKLRTKTTLRDCFKKSGFEELEINLSHAIELKRLSLYHKDPFDRILISQAKVENLTLITSDRKIWKYEVPLLKA